ncbi:MAG: beta-lactamase family protein [Maribacter sp.]|nr:beta-lactamase family protein [Maribacter sp.]
MKFILAFILLLLCNVALSEDLNVSATKLMQDFFLKSGAPGLSVSVGYDDKIVWSKGFGYADLEQKVTVEPSQTKFRVGSVAKPFTAFALAKLLDSKKLELDSEIQSYVPSFPKKKFPITIRQIAGHLSGIRHYQGDEFYSHKKYNSVLEGLVIFQDDPLEHKPGDKWSYTSYGYNLLSAAIEQASGKTFLDYMTEDVFLPLGVLEPSPKNQNSLSNVKTKYYEIGRNFFFLALA